MQKRPRASEPTPTSAFRAWKPRQRDPAAPLA